MVDALCNWGRTKKLMETLEEWLSKGKIKLQKQINKKACGWKQEWEEEINFNLPLI